MQSNYGYDISSGEEEGSHASQTAAANPNDQHPKITAHHSNHINHSSDGGGHIGCNRCPTKVGTAHPATR